MQSRWMSLVEAVTNIVVGYGLAVLTQIIVFPLFGLACVGERQSSDGGVFTGHVLDSQFCAPAPVQRCGETGLT